MANLIQKLSEKKLISPPPWLPTNMVLLSIVGSYSYGVSGDTSDCDVVGITMPPKGMLFPHLDGFLPGYDLNPPTFNQFEAHHVKESEHKEYDLTVYSIVKYFRLCADGNPNMVDSIFTPINCVLLNTTVGEHIRNNRKLFLSKKCFHSFKGYAYSQLSKIKNKTNPTSEKRKATIEKYGWDLKYGYHLVRLINECEQILAEGDLDLQRSKEQLKTIRNGEWSIDQVEDYFVQKEKNLETLYTNSTAVPFHIREDEIKQVLMECLEMHYGSLDKTIHNPNKDTVILNQIQQLMVNR